MHSDLGPDVPPSGFLGWFLTGLGQQYGFPVPEGGAGQLTAALVRRLAARGGIVRCPARVERIVVRDRRAVAVVLADGETIDARTAACSPTSAHPRSTATSSGEEHLPARSCADLGRFQYDLATFKIDWALSGPIPWRAEAATRAGTVHLADSMDRVTQVRSRPRAGPDPRAPVRARRADEQGRSDRGRRPAPRRSGRTRHVPHAAPRRRRRQPPRHAGTRRRPRPSPTVSRREIEAHAPGFRSLVTGAPPARPARARGPRRQPRGRRHRRRDHGVLPAARVPARSRGSGGPRRRSAGCSSRRPRPTRAAACTARAARTPPAPRSSPTGSAASPEAPSAEAGQARRKGSDLFRA